MKTKYLLSCSCGRMIRLEPRQAGEAVRCECGKETSAPTMREILALPSENDEPGDPKSAVSSWNAGGRLLIIGSIFVLIALVGGGAVWLSWPYFPSNEVFVQAYDRDLHAATPLKAWKFYRDNILPGIETSKSPMEKTYDQVRLQYLGWLGLVSALGGIGVLLLGLGIVQRVR